MCKWLPFICWISICLPLISSSLIFGKCIISLCWCSVVTYCQILAKYVHLLLGSSPPIFEEVHSTSELLVRFSEPFLARRVWFACLNCIRLYLAILYAISSSFFISILSLFGVLTCNFNDCRYCVVLVLWCIFLLSLIIRVTFYGLFCLNPNLC